MMSHILHLKHKKYSVMYLVAILAALLTTGCSSTADYSTFATAGKTYTTAMDNLLLSSAAVHIDANSELLLQDYSDRVANNTSVPSDLLENFDKKNAAFVSASEQLRDMTRLLGLYFETLSSLASSSAPQAAKTASENLGSSLSSLVKETKLKVSIPEKTLVGEVGKIVINVQLSGALGEELSARKETLKEVLAIQKILLDTVQERLVDDLSTIQKAQSSRKLAPQLQSKELLSDAKKDAFITLRQNILLNSFQNKLATYNAAREAESKMRNAFILLLNGDISPEKVIRVKSAFETAK